MLQKRDGDASQHDKRNSEQKLCVFDWLSMNLKEKCRQWVSRDSTFGFVVLGHRELGEWCRK